MGWGLNILHRPTGTFYPAPELKPPKTFPAPHPCFQDLQTGMDARSLAIDCVIPLVDLIKLKNREYRSKSCLERKIAEFGLGSKSVESIGIPIDSMRPGNPTEISRSATKETCLEARVTRFRQPFKCHQCCTRLKGVWKLARLRRRTQHWGGGEPGIGRAEGPPKSI